MPHVPAYAALSVALLLVLFDLQNLASRWRGRVLGPALERDPDFTLMIPVYGAPRFFGPANRAHHERWKPHVLVLIETGAPGMADLADEVEADGWRVHRCRVQGACCPKMIADALASGAVTTTYALRVDADTTLHEDVGRFVAAMRADGADLCSVKVLVNEPRTQAERFQALEYRMAMLSRHFRPMLTSGACYFARTDALARVLASHSMWWMGEDVETGRIAKALGMRVRHLDMEAYTDAPRTWRALFMQRRGWWAGNFRHSIVNLDRNVLQMPVWSAYYVGLVWVGAALRWESLGRLADPRYAAAGLALMWALYVAVTFAANGQVASWRMLLFPPYAALQAFLMTMVGAVYYVVLCRRIGGMGRYLFPHFRSRPRERPEDDAEGALVAEATWAAGVLS